MAEPFVDAAREIELLEVELRRLETEYQMFFAGQLPRPPWETRGRVDALIKRIDRTPPSNYGARFRFTTLQSRFMAFVHLWDRSFRAREEGRAGPFTQAPSIVEQATPPRDRVLAVATVGDPTRDQDTVRDLFENFAAARREAGQAAVPFQRFAELIGTQVSAFRKKGCAEMSFRVSLKDGKAVFSGRGKRGTGVSTG